MNIANVALSWIYLPTSVFLLVVKFIGTMSEFSFLFLKNLWSIETL